MLSISHKLKVKISRDVSIKSLCNNFIEFINLRKLIVVQYTDRAFRPVHFSMVLIALSRRCDISSQNL